MEKSTYFLPSIHGWPFTNSFHFTGTLEEYLGIDFIFIIGNINLDGDYGYCGGMCFTALDRFYRAEYIPDSLNAPQQGDDLYEEIRERLIDSLNLRTNGSLNLDTIFKIHDWQKASDETVGMVTEVNWYDIKSNIDLGYPIQLLLMRTTGRKYSTLIENHQVIAYKYTVDELNKKVEIFIYDPIYPNRNDVSISFYYNQPNNNIKASQSTGETLRGFFKIPYDGEVSTPTIYDLGNDGWEFIDRFIDYRDSTRYRFDKFRIKFHWSCNFIPFFTLLRNDEKFVITDLYSESLRFSEDIELNEATGYYETEFSIATSPGDPYSQPIDLFFVSQDNHIVFRIELVPPAIEAHPFLHSIYKRVFGINIPQTIIADGGLSDVEIIYPDADLDSDQKMTEQEKQDNWDRRIYVNGGTVENISGIGSIFVYRITYKLGYVTSQIKAEFEEKALLGIVDHSGESYLIDPSNPNVKIDHQQFNSLNPLDSFQFYDGFSRTNYDQDHELVFDYKAEDEFSQVAQGQIKIFAKSLLCIQRLYLTAVLPFDPEWDSIRFRIYEDTFLKLKEEIYFDLRKLGQKKLQEVLLFLKQKVEELVNRELKQLKTESMIWKRIYQSNMQIYNSMKKKLNKFLYTETDYSEVMVQTEKLKLELPRRTGENTAKILVNEIYAKKKEVKELIKTVLSKFQKK